MSAAPFDSLNLGMGSPRRSEGKPWADEPAAVTANRERAARELGRDPARVVWMNQVHGREVAVVTGPWGDAPAPDVDALVTTRADLTLGVLTADCVPVLLADPAAGVCAAAHAGRPGMAAGVVTAAVEMMITLGADPARTTAVLGPAVCGKCYEVPAAMREEVAATEPAAHAETSWGTPALDVAAGVRAQLLRAGVRAVRDCGVCTLESADHFSYRRDGTTGRLAGYVWLDGLTDGPADGAR